MTFTIYPPVGFWEWVLLFAAAMTDSDENSRLERFNSLVSRHSDLLSRTCYFYAHTANDYHEMRQDTLINIWRGIDSFRGDCAESTWIYRVCINTCISSLRRKSRRGRKCVPLSTLYESVPDSNPEEDIRVEQLHRLISRLGAEDRAIIMMWLDEMPYEDIASVMGLGRNTIATRLRRIKQKLITFKQSQQ